MKKTFILLFAFIGMSGFFNTEASTLTQRLADSFVIDGLKHGLDTGNLKEFLDQVFTAKYTAGVAAVVCGSIAVFPLVYLIKKAFSKAQEHAVKSGMKMGFAAILTALFGALAGGSILGYNVFDQILLDNRNVPVFVLNVTRLVATYGKFE